MHSSLNLFEQVCEPWSATARCVEEIKDHCYIVTPVLRWLIMTTSTGYGPRTSRPFFYGNEERYELWEVKFVGYLRLQKLHDTILQPGEGGLAADKLDAEKNAEAFAELTLSIDDRSLSLVLRDAKDDGRKALKILRTMEFLEGH